MSVFLNMVLTKEGCVYPSVYLKLENDEEVVLSYVQYFHTSLPSTVKVTRVNTDLGICEDITYTNVKWMQVLN